MRVCLQFALVLGIFSQPLAACRLWAICAKSGLSLPTFSSSEQTVVINQLTAFYDQSVSMVHGWALLGYAAANPDSVEPIYRSDSPATEDSTLYWEAVETLMEENDHIIGLGHLRLATSGTNSIPNPHPFLFYHEGISYSFIHNGTVDKDLVYNLITNDSTDLSWLIDHEPQTYGGGSWQEEGWSNVVDSELLMLYMMQNILSTASVLTGLETALSNLVNEGVPMSQLNLIFSDGTTLYIFGGTNGLSIAESEAHYAVMTLPPTDGELNWAGISLGDLVVINGDGISYYSDFAEADPNDPPIVPIEEFLVMLPAYPNPFNASVTFDLVSRPHEKVTLKIHSILGEHIYHHELTMPNSGLKKFTWNAESQNNRGLASGTYFIKANTSTLSKTQKILFIK